MAYFRADAKDVKVGAFLLLSLGLLVAAAIVVGDVGRWFTAKHRYTVLLPNANLLHERALVSYAGLPVGEVVEVTTRAEADRARQHPTYPIAVTIAVRASVPVHANARIEMKTDGFIGDRYLDIAPGDGDLVADGGTLLGAIGGVEGMLASLSGLGGGLGEISDAVRTLLTDTSQAHSLPRLLANVQQQLDTLGPRLTTLSTGADDLLHQVKQEVARTSQQAGIALQRLDTTIADNRDGLQQLMRELNAGLADARQTLAVMQRFLESSETDVAGLIQSVRTVSERLQQQTEAMAAQLQQLLARTDTMVAQNDRNIYVTIENLRDMTDNLKATSQLLRANPAVLLWGHRGSNGARPDAAVPDTDQVLRDRGRIGRYDRTP